MPPKKNTIVIVGGGLSGLAVARVLKAKNTPSIVLERRSRGRKYDFAINLRKQAVEPFAQRIGMDYSSFRAAVAVNFPMEDKGRIGSPMMDAKTGDSIGPGFHLTWPEEGYFRAQWSRLRSMLTEGLDVSFRCFAQTHISSSSGVLVQCIDPFTGKALKSVKGALVVGADGLNSQVRWQLGMREHLMHIPAIVLQAVRFMSRSKFDLEVGPYLNNSSVVTGCVENWRLCISVDSVDEKMVVLCNTYSRPCVDRKEFALLYPTTHGRQNRPLDKIPRSLEEELKGLCPLAHPFDTTHNIDELSNDVTHLWLMRGHRTRKEAFRSTFTESAAPTVLVGDAANVEPLLLSEGANHALQDAVHLGDLIAAAGEEVPLHPVADRFHRSAYDSRWLKATLAWEHKFCSFHGIDSPMQHSWQSTDRNFSRADPFSGLRGEPKYRPQDLDSECFALRRSKEMRESHADFQPVIDSEPKYRPQDLDPECFALRRNKEVRESHAAFQSVNDKRLAVIKRSYLENERQGKKRNGRKQFDYYDPRGADKVAGRLRTYRLWQICCGERGVFLAPMR